MKTFDLEKIEEIQIDYSNLDEIIAFSNAIDDAIEPYRVKVESHGLVAVQDSKKFITKVKNKVKKYFKEKRDHVNKIRTNIIDAEKKAAEPLALLEEDLKEEVRIEAERQELEFAKLKLPSRNALLAQYDLHIDEEVLLRLNDIEFQEQINSMLAEIEKEKQREAEKQEAIKEAEKKAKAEMEIKLAEAEKRAKEQAEELERQKAAAEKKAKEQAEAEKKAKEIAEKNKSIIEAAKAEVGFNDKNFKIAQSGSTLAIWKCVKVIKLKENK